MPIRVVQGVNSTQLTALARGKAARECNRPEYDLRLLLAHIKILDQLEHSAAEISSKSSIEQERNSQREVSQTQELDDLNELFIPASTLASSPSLVTVEELGEEDFDA